LTVEMACAALAVGALALGFGLAHRRQGRGGRVEAVTVAAIHSARAARSEVVVDLAFGGTTLPLAVREACCPSCGGLPDLARARPGSGRGLPAPDLMCRCGRIWTPALDLAMDGAAT
jgi:hypothetical protein